MLNKLTSVALLFLVLAQGALSVGVRCECPASVSSYSICLTTSVGRWNRCRSLPWLRYIYLIDISVLVSVLYASWDFIPVLRSLTSFIGPPDEMCCATDTPGVNVCLLVRPPGGPQCNAPI
ncbi:hypothetical protein B0H13DRAFT_2112173 [Mycena leptocephala]|nr:hypothetical protein B0H13DRAFT_2112173 [Mycena leptocephala]